MNRILTIFLLISISLAAVAQKEVLKNRPYIDNRKYHWGFQFGMNMQDMEIANTGYIDPATGEQWMIDVDSYQPGFSVGVLGAMRLNKYFELRFTPMIHFGQKHLLMYDAISKRDTTQNLKTNYISLPISVKFSAPRHNNFRPYFVAGFAPTICLNNPDHEAIKVKPFDLYLEIGLGCDFYLPYFKLIPELKFCFGLLDIIQKDRKDLIDNNLIKFTKSVDKSHSSMIVLTLYFE